MEVTKKQFLAYESIRVSGRTNMFNNRNVVDFSGGKLTKDVVFDIMSNYVSLSEKYLTGDR